jgi:hypothetical protein
MYFPSTKDKKKANKLQKVTKKSFITNSAKKCLPFSLLPLKQLDRILEKEWSVK